MNRPKIEDYAREVYWERNFIVDLEAYCDEIESKLEMATGTIVMLDDKLTSIEKALDKACNMLDLTYATMGYEYDVDEEYRMNEDEWKEWCLRDE